MKRKIISLLLAAVMLVSTLASCAFNFDAGSSAQVALDLSGITGTIRADQVLTIDAAEFEKILLELASANATSKADREEDEKIEANDTLSLSVAVTQTIGAYTTPTLVSLTVVVKKGEITSCTVAGETDEGTNDYVKNALCDKIRELMATADGVKVGDEITATRTDVYISGSGTAKKVEKFDADDKWGRVENKLDASGNTVDENGDGKPDTETVDTLISETMKGVTTVFTATVSSATKDGTSILLSQGDVVSLYYYYGDHTEHDFGFTNLDTATSLAGATKKTAFVYDGLSEAHSAVEQAFMNQILAAGTVYRNDFMEYLSGVVNPDDRDFAEVKVFAYYEKTENNTTTKVSVSDLGATKNLFLGKEDTSTGFGGVWSWEEIRTILLAGNVEVDKEADFKTVADLWIDKNGKALKTDGDVKRLYTESDNTADLALTKQTVVLKYTLNDLYDTKKESWQTATVTVGGEETTVTFFVADVKTPQAVTLENLKNQSYANASKYTLTSTASSAKDGKEEITRAFYLTEQHDHLETDSDGDGHNDESGFTLLVNSSLGAVICKFKTENNVTTYYKYDPDSEEDTVLTFDDLFVDELEDKKSFFPSMTGAVDSEEDIVRYSMLYYLLVQEEQMRMQKGIAALWKIITEKSVVTVPQSLLDNYYDELYENARYTFYYANDGKVEVKENSSDKTALATFEDFDDYLSYYAVSQNPKNEEAKKADMVKEAAELTAEGRRTYIDAMAKEALSPRLIIHALADRLDITLSEEEYEERLNATLSYTISMYNAYGITFPYATADEFVKATYGSKEGAKTGMLFDTVMESIYKNEDGSFTYILTYDAAE